MFTNNKFHFNELSKYSHNNSFYFSSNDELQKVCNAPKDCAGVYMVYAVKNGCYKILYIGISGKIMNNGNIKIRRGGIYDRIVNGKHFNGRRKYTWKNKIAEERIDMLYVEWYDTYTNHHHIPKSIEGKLLQEYYNFFFRLPPWNKEY